MLETNDPPARRESPPLPPGALHSLTVENFLSFGPERAVIPLRALNVLIGPNGSGKSNLVEVFELLSAAPHDFSRPFRGTGGVRNWIHGQRKDGSATVGASISESKPLARRLAHWLQFTEEEQRLRITDEQAYDLDAPQKSVLRLGVLPNQSKLAALPGDSSTRELAEVRAAYFGICLYRNWTLGPSCKLRDPQSADLPDDVLAEDFSNLLLILNRLEFEPEARDAFLARVKDFLPDVTDYKLRIAGGTIQLFLREGKNDIPAARLSDGTLRWLCLLAILVAPSPPGVVVMEEPEVGLHPDMINTLAALLREASTRLQVVVTTHSDILIDALSDTPESILVVEKEDGQTKVKRLDEEELKPWLDEYRLGRLWMSGKLGGTRW